MKPFATSAVLHALVLTWGLWHFQPAPLDLTQGEALPVSVVPIEEYSEVVAGDDEAPMTETPAPTPTQAPERTPMPAENVGENEVDLDTPPRPQEAPRETVQTATADAPPPAAEPEPEPQPQEAPPEEATPEPVPVPEPEPEPEPQPTEQAAVEPAPEPEPQLPQNVPTPQVRPQPPQPVETPRPQPTRTAERTPQERPAQDQTEREFDADEIAALLNREQSAGGGARRSEQAASLGGQRTTGAKLSQSELDALRAQVQRCWSPPAGISDAGTLRVSIQMQLDPSGALIGVPQIVNGGGSSTAERVAGEAAVRAVRRCAPYSLPSDKYDSWRQVQINFDPSQMF
ncbi:cell envelope integrity protein TolA [Aureimonas frigidaquae]|uniref:cell envelope integrity protein TolA n=1 Tax=Aureimonas frigidaquae TaxID=424757 RepID=UPI000782AC3F|nr:hypothetical protein [Aureimonas frigidaquae]